MTRRAEDESRNELQGSFAKALRMTVVEGWGSFAKAVRMTCVEGWGSFAKALRMTFVEGVGGCAKAPRMTYVERWRDAAKARGSAGVEGGGGCPTSIAVSPRLRWGVTVAALLVASAGHAQQTTVPAAAGAGTTTQGVPVPERSGVLVEAPQVPPLAPLVAGQVPQAPEVTAAEQNSAVTQRIATTGLRPNFLGFLGPYRRPYVPPLFPGSGTRLGALIRDGKLYLSLHDALALAIENNLDVEVERYNLQLATADQARAAGGGATRGIDLTVQEPPNGVGGPGSPLLNADTTSTNPTTPTVTDLTSLNSTQQVQMNYSALGTGFQYSTGPNVPLFDPSLFVEAGYLRRSNIVQLGSAGGTGTGTGSTGGSSSASGTATATGPFDYIATNISYLQGFRTGLQLEATVNNDSSVVYGSAGQLDPFSTPSTSVTLTQPLLRGRGSAVNLRYLRIAKLNQGISRLLFEQQVLETVYGVSRLYFDLVSLGENVVVKQEALKAAEKLRQDDADQVSVGSLAPIELVRAEALASSSRFDLIQAQGLFQQEEVILRNQLIRAASPAFASFTEIVPTDRIIVPDELGALPVPELVREGLAKRPDLAQSELQIKSGEVSVNAARNNALLQLNLYANFQSRGSTEQAYEQLGSTGTALPTLPTNFALGGLRTSTIYQAGLQMTLPVRNRTATADAARDTVQLRQVQARTERLSDQIREEIETAVIALQTAQSAYKAAVTSRGYQEQLLEAERDKLQFGESTPLLVIQNETYLAQARSTEIAARSNWQKARIELDHALGTTLLEKNGIALDEAVQGTVR